MGGKLGDMWGPMVSRKMQRRPANPVFRIAHKNATTHTLRSSPYLRRSRAPAARKAPTPGPTRPRRPGPPQPRWTRTQRSSQSLLRVWLRTPWGERRWAQSQPPTRRQELPVRLRCGLLSLATTRAPNMPQMRPPLLGDDKSSQYASDAASSPWRCPTAPGASHLGSCGRASHLEPPVLNSVPGEVVVGRPTTVALGPCTAMEVASIQASVRRESL